MKIIFDKTKNLSTKYREINMRNHVSTLKVDSLFVDEEKESEFNWEERFPIESYGLMNPGTATVSINLIRTMIY